jgi:hypothetical protein
MVENNSITTKSGMVRILFEITSLPKKGEVFLARPTVKIKKVDVFPLAFIFSEDCLQDPYSLISESIRLEGHKIMDNLPVCDPGIYELVGEFFGKFSLSGDQVVNRLWEITEVKAYQLTDEEIELLPPTLRFGEETTPNPKA